jgi:hypothetical protein
MTRNAASVPSQPIAFQRRVKPTSAATSPAASGGLWRDQRPITNSATRRGVAIARQAITKTKMKAKPPLVPAR